MQGLQPLRPMPATASPQPGELPGMVLISLLTLSLVLVPKPEQPVQVAATTKDPISQIKKTRGRPKKDGPAQSGKMSTPDSSDDELEVEDEDPPEMIPALLSVSMPSDERGKALYRAVQAVWSPRNKGVDAEKIRAGITGFGETIKALRDSWKTKQDSLRKAELENSPTAADAPKLKEEVARYRQVMEAAMSRSLQYGHPAIVKRYVIPPPFFLHPVPGSMWRDVGIGCPSRAISALWKYARMRDVHFRDESESHVYELAALLRTTRIYSSTLIDSPPNRVPAAVSHRSSPYGGHRNHHFVHLITLTDIFIQTRRQSHHAVRHILLYARQIHCLRL
jgi:hypothetical protein